MIFARCLLLLSAGALLLGCRRETLDAEASARRFFDQVRDGHPMEAYESSAFAFQAQQSGKAFEARAKELGFIGSVIELKPLSSEAKTAKFDVTVSKDGKKLPLVATLQLESGSWRLFSLRSPRNSATGLSENRFTIVGRLPSFSEDINRPMPDETAVRRLIRESMMQFSAAIGTRSFKNFYDYTAAAWQSQLTERQLQNAFQAFIDKEVDLAGIAQTEPVLDSTPQISADGLLLVGGSYPTKPYAVFFSLKFIYELPQWKLFGLDVYLRKPSEEGAPAPRPSVSPQ